MTALEFHATAQADLDEIWTYVAHDRGTTVADGLIDGMYETLNRVILRQPGSGRKRPEFGEDVRSFPIVPYVVFYRILQDRVRILRILHGRRDIKRPLMSLLTAAS